MSPIDFLTKSISVMNWADEVEEEQSRIDSEEHAQDKVEYQVENGSEDNVQDVSKEKPQKASEEQNCSLDDGFVKVKAKNVMKEERRVLKAAISIDIDLISRIDDGSTKVKDLTKQEIKELFAGPTIAIYASGRVWMMHAYKRALMAVSSRARTALMSNPALTSIQFDKCGADAGVKVLKAIMSTLPHIRLPLGHSFVECVKIYQAANAIGVEEYTNEQLRLLRKTVSNRLLSYAELDAVLQFLSSSDPVFTHVAHNLAHRRFLKQIPDTEAFEAYLEEHSSLQTAMATIDKNNRRVRKDFRREH